MYHVFFIHSSVDGHLGCFHVLAIVNSAAMGCMHPFESWFSPDICPGVRLYSAIRRNEIMPFAATRMDLETVIQSEVRDFPGGPVVKTLRFYWMGHRFDPWLGTKIPHATRRGQKQTNKKEWRKSERESQISYNIAYIWNLKKNGTNELIYKTERELQMQKTNLWLPRCKGWGRINWILGLTCTHYCI